MIRGAMLENKPRRVDAASYILYSNLALRGDVEQKMSVWVCVELHAYLD